MRPTGGMDRGKARLHLIYCYRAVDNPGEWVCGSKKLQNICWQPSWCSVVCGLWLSMGYPLVFSGLVFWQAWSVVE